MRKTRFILASLGIVALLLTCQKLDFDLITKVRTISIKTGLTNVEAKGEILELSNAKHDDFGFCYGTDTDPTVDDNAVGLTANPATGEFDVNITNLTPNTKYYIRPYCKEGNTYIYGETVEAKTSILTFTDEDNNTYNGVEIGTQVWMQENLKVTKYRNGDPIELITEDNLWSSTETGAYCWYNNDAENKTEYGGLYNYYTISDSRNVCPVGWHIPSDEEWQVLSDYLGGDDISGGKLKEFGLSHWISPNNFATNSSGFTAYPGGYREYDGAFNYFGEEGKWWSNTINDLTTAIFRYIYNTYNTFFRETFNKKTGMSIRCLQGDIPQLTTTSIDYITFTTATSGGNITSNGGYAISARGVCWSTTQNPTISNDHTTNGNDIGVFTSELTDLTPGTTYYVRAYATNSLGTGYGNQVSFITESYKIPTVSTTSITGYTHNSAVSGGSISDDGGAAVTAKGVCWSQSQNPTILDPHTTDGTGTATYTSNIISLVSNTKYYVRAYATNSVGTAYGNELEFTTLVEIFQPTVTTAVVTNYTATTASGGGDVTDDGNGLVTAKGICWSISQNPTTADDHTDEGSGTGPFTSDMNDLTPNTTYYVRAYAINEKGTAFGDQVSFTTLHEKVIPIVTSTSVSALASTSVNTGGEVTSDGYGTITARGVCWGTTANPTITGEHTSDGTTIGVFTTSLSGLNPNTTYYLRAYATNEVGTGYGDDVTFTTTQTVTDIDGNTYNTVQIGTQLWMQENLITTQYRDGTNIPNVTDNTEWTNQSIGAYCYYNNDKATYGVTYGALYNYYTTIDNHQLCPTGWHIPTDAEWTTLTDYLGGESVAGIKMKEVGLLHWSDPNTGSTNESNFLALPSGCRNYSTGTFYDIGFGGFWWSSTESEATKGFLRALYHDSQNIYRENYFNNYGYSIRCLQGEGQVLPAVTTTLYSNLTSTTATSGGNVTSDGNSTVTARGVVWSTNQNPTIDLLTKTEDGTGTGEFTSNVTNLTPNTTYYLKAYATNGMGTAYGNEISFSTPAGASLPTVSTVATTGITNTTAISGGEVTDLGNGTVSAKGVCWGTSASPTIAGDHTTDGTGIGVYTSSLTSLTANTTYYYRAYATNEAGTAYGTELSFTTYNWVLGTVTDYDGNSYNTVQIGTQTWMQENLKVTHYRNGDAIPNITDNTDWTNQSSGALCYYNNDETNNSSIYGALYNFYTAVDNRQLCPSGWHVPTNAEFTLLTDYLGGTDLASGKLKEDGLSHWADPNTGADNSSGYTALPGGYRNGGDGNYFGSSIYADWWSSSESSAGTANYLFLNNNTTIANNYSGYKSTGISIRCLLGEGQVLPVVTTSSISAIASSTVNIGGNVTSDGGVTVTARGVCWSTTQNPTVGLTTKTVDASGTGIFTSSVTGLTPNTTYYLRAYATNSVGTVYGNEVSFNTTIQVSDVDGNTYNTVQIGSQLWMQENLKVTKYRNNDPIPIITNNAEWANQSDGALGWYGNDELNNKDTYGGLYNYFTTLDNRQLCPTGWHVPTNAEWIVLTDYLGGANGAGGKLKESGLIHWGDPNTGATNESGFTALPGGIRNTGDGGYSDLQSYGYYWSSTVTDPTYSKFRLLNFNNPDIYENNGIKSDGFSVRCLQGEGQVLPTVTTTTYSNLTTTAVTSGGNVTSDGNSTVTARGVVWSTSQNPTVDLITKTADGTGTGAFISNPTSLTPNTTYYLRAYATNGVGTAYGNEISFSTPVAVSLPTVSTVAATGITNTTAISGGEVTDLGGGTISAKGVCWGTSPNPTISGDHTTDGTGIGVYSSSLTSLTANTTYYYRAYATNETGTAYGTELSFTTYNWVLGTVTDYDGNSYNTVQIGTQTWMQENLKVTHYRNGDAISKITDNGAWISQTNGAHCYYNNDETTNKEIYGALYNYFTTIDNRQLCPTGWHVPTDEELTTLTDFLGGITVAGDKLKATTLWTTNTTADNSSGFSALPGGGRRDIDGAFDGVGTHGHWWTSTEFDATNTWIRYLTFDFGGVNRNNLDKRYGFSVRCLLGEGQVLPAVTTTSTTSIASTTANSGGNVTSDGGVTVTARGVCWSTSQNPTVDLTTKTVDASGTGIFTSSITGLTPNTTYYLRAYATNSVGTVYGNEVSFTTTIQVSDYDGNNYNTVQIGTQLWMQENLKVTHYRNSDAIPNVTDGATWAGLTDGAYCWYNNDPETYKTTYGGLYNFYTTIDNRQLCPTGWHVPTNDEWTTLETYLEGSSVAGGKLKSILLWSSPNTGADNSSGFTAFPGGSRDYSNGSFGSILGYGFWWTATGIETTPLAFFRDLYSGAPDFYLNWNNKNFGFSVRCLQGEGQVLPALSTTAASSVTGTTALSGGNVTSDGNSPVTVRGVCWSTTQNPTADLTTKTVDGSGTGSFISNITGLAEGTTYYVRAYATNSVGTAYGNEVSFTTISLPTVTTASITEVTNTTAKGGGEVTNLGNGIVSEKGVCWGTTSNPTIAGSHSSDGSGLGAFTSDLTGLTANTTYYVRAYATNEAGTAYGNEVSFSTFNWVLGTVTDYDGNTYKTVQIGTQTWMQENLKVTHYRNGDAIPNVTNNTEWQNQTDGALCYYNNDEVTNKPVYGAFYNYYTTIDNRNLCPTGWHVPTNAEIITLTNYLGGESVAGGKMKQTGTTYWITPNTGADNSSGFTSLAAGVHAADFIGIGYKTGIWSTTEYDIYAWSRELNYNGIAIVPDMSNRKNGYSVRCLQGEGQVLPAVTTTSATAIASTTVNSGGNVTSDGGATVTARGVCWSTSQNPTVDLTTKTVDASGTGAFTSNVTGLTPNTTYYLRAYATNSVGTVYGAEVTFTTNIQVTDYDGNTYNTVQIGTQLWMQENLKVTHYRNGDAIPNVTDNGSWTGLTIGAYCWYNNDEGTYKAIYGGLYNYHTTIDGRYLCPTGWHVPTDDEWTYLETYLGGAGVAGGKLKATILWTDPNTGATNASGFSALPGGYRDYDGIIFAGIEEVNILWSSTEYNETYSYARRVIYNTSDITGSGGGYNKKYGNSVRCLQGEGLVLPAITTEAATAVTSTTTTSGGNITSDGGASVTARGVCWSTSTNPTVDLTTKTVDASGTGSFTSSLTGLTPNTTYYVRAYATNSVGTVYGNEVSFITSTEAPTVTTSPVTGLASTSINYGGDVTSDGGAAVTARGICWDNSSNPTTSGNHTTDGAGTGTFTGTKSGLIPNTTYYVRAYATNSVGTSYGNEISFTTTIQVTDYNSNIYNTVQIGTQLWFQENLKVTNYRNGDAIPNVTDNATWAGVTSGAYCWYNNDEGTYKATYGGLYNYYSTVDNRQLCPTGWHVPNDTEWTTLTSYLGGESIAGGKMKETGITHWTDPNEGATNESGFTLLPGGTRNYQGSYGSINLYSSLWSTTIYSSLYARDREQSYVFTYIANTYDNKTAGLSIRCLQGEGQVLPAITTEAATAVTSTTATSGGNITSDGGATVTARGVCWSTSANPTVDLTTKTVDASGTGAFTSSLSGLSPNTTYYVRAYATNSVGTAYGNEVSLTTDPNIVADADGNTYNVIRIGTQLWTIENLRTTKYSSDGSSITNLTLNSAWTSTSSGAYCWYNNDEATYKSTYGALYNFYAVVDIKNICPTGWHVPTSLDWANLESYYGGSIWAGGPLKEAGTSHWSGPNTGATNSSGFTGLPGGARNGNYDGIFQSLGLYCLFWSSTLDGSSAYMSQLSYSNQYLTRSTTDDLKGGLSVRCIKN